LSKQYNKVEGAAGDIPAASFLEVEVRLAMKHIAAALAVLFALCLLPGMALGEEVVGDFTFTEIGGKAVSSAEFKGKPLVVVMLASWCPPCKNEAPDLEKAYKAYKGKGVVFLGVFSASSDSSIRKFAEKYGLTFPVGRAEGLAEMFGLKPFPSAAFVAPGGRVLRKHTGQISYEELSEGIEEILK